MERRTQQARACCVRRSILSILRGVVTRVQNVSEYMLVLALMPILVPVDEVLVLLVVVTSIIHVVHNLMFLVNGVSILQVATYVLLYYVMH